MTFHEIGSISAQGYVYPRVYLIAKIHLLQFFAETSLLCNDLSIYLCIIDLQTVISRLPTLEASLFPSFHPRSSLPLPPLAIGLHQFSCRAEGVGCTYIDPIERASTLFPIISIEPPPINCFICAFFLSISFLPSMQPALQPSGDAKHVSIIPARSTKEEKD